MAIYQSKFLSPMNTSIDATVNNIFSCILQGSSITKYNAKIYNNSTGVQVYTTGDVPISPTKYNGDLLEFTVPQNTLTNGIEYKWEITTFEQTSSATSMPSIFRALTTPTVAISLPTTITSQSYTFNFSYSQVQNVPILYWYMEFRDSNNELLKTTDRNYNGNISYKYSGFVSGQTYSVKAIVVSSSGLESQSAIYNFAVAYSKPNVTLIPTIVQDCVTSIVNIIWGGAIIVFGVITGTYSYIQNYGIINNWALDLGGGGKFSITTNIPETQTSIIAIKHNGFTGGAIAKLVGSYGDYEFGYDTATSRFYFNNKGIFGYSQTMPLPTVDYHIFIRAQNAYVKINNILYKLDIE